jgi:hypothetical protein
MKVSRSFFEKKLKNIYGFEYKKNNRGHTVSFLTSTLIGNPSVIAVMHQVREIGGVDVEVRDLTGVGVRVIFSWSDDDSPQMVSEG